MPPVVNSHPATKIKDGEFSAVNSVSKVCKMYAEMVAVCGSLRFYKVVKFNDKELLSFKMRSQPVAYIEPMLRAGWSVVLISAVAREFSLPQNVQAGSRAHQDSYSVWTGLFPGGRDVDHSPPSNAEVRNEWSYTSAPLYAFLEWTGQLFLFHS